MEEWQEGRGKKVKSRDSNPGHVFSIQGFEIGGFLIPGSPVGLWDSGGMRSKTVIIEYMGLRGILLNLRFFVAASQAFASRLML